MVNLEKIGHKITELRKSHNMKQNDLADTLFVTHQAVSKWENGKSIPSIEIMYELTKLFNVTIDYLLDDSEIKEDDYDTMLRIYPRKSVISKFLQKKDVGSEIEKIFYLLNNEERKIIINMMINNKISILPEDIWHVLSKKERVYLLGVILSNKYDYDLSLIYHKLTDEEESMVRKHHRVGVYKYKLPHGRGVIRNENHKKGNV